MRVTALQLWRVEQEEQPLPDPPPGHWRMLSGLGEAAIRVEERVSGMRMHKDLSRCALVMKPGMFEGGGRERIWLLPTSDFVVADMTPRDPSRACNFCATAGVRLQKCARCMSVRYW